MSVFSSVAPDKPSVCPSEAIIEQAVRESDNDYYQNDNSDQPRIVLEIIDVDENNGTNYLNDGEEIPIICVENNNNGNEPNENMIVIKTNIPENIDNDQLRTVGDLRENVDINNLYNRQPVETDDNVKIRSKKRQKDPQNWKQNIRKRKRQSGEEYVNVKGKMVPKRDVKDKTCISKNCVFKCSRVISEEERILIHKSFWHLNDEKKLHFYSKHIKRSLASRKRTANEFSRKTWSYQYFFIVSGVTVRVCQEFFLNTLNISKQRVYHYFKKCRNQSTEIPLMPLQGKHTKKVISEEKKAEVRMHIKSFPTVPSHYCRSSTNKQYLERDLNLRRMYELYEQQYQDPVKFHTYQTIFNTEFNINFFKSKKDICDKCAEYTANKNPTAEETQKYNEHIKRKLIGNQERDNDRIRYKDDDRIGVITFDLENTFSLPKSNVSKNFYKMKLCCYNFTAHCNRNNTVYNAIWHEALCGRAGIHIANALIRILKAIVNDNPNLEKLILWSDSCVPQNKNSIMSFALQWFLTSDHAKNLQTIEQKFGEPGHGNVQEIDCAHSCIEKLIRNLEIWTPLTLIRILLSIPKTWKQKFHVLQMRHSDYLDFQTLSTRFTYNYVPYTKVKQLIYEKNCLINIKYKESFEGPVTTAKLKYAKRINLEKEVKIPQVIPQIQHKKCVINEQKKKHLLEMLPQMPEEERSFYYSLLEKETKT